jgi:hypothetical protein
MFVKHVAGAICLAFGDEEAALAAIGEIEHWIIRHLKLCAASALNSGSDFNQGVVRGLEIAAAQVEFGHCYSAGTLCPKCGLLLDEGYCHECDEWRSIQPMTAPIVERLRAAMQRGIHGAPTCVADAADTIEELVGALRKIVDMTDIEADFDGFEARQIATDALAKIGEGQCAPDRTDLLGVFRELYASEINCGIESFWDGGFTVFLGDHMNGRKAETVFYPDELDDAAEWLIGQARRVYPRFASFCAPANDGGRQ